MKKTLIGGFLAFLGSLWALVIIAYACNHLVSSWNSDLGRLYATISDYELTIPFVLALILLVFGLVILLVELFRKEK